MLKTLTSSAPGGKGLIEDLLQALYEVSEPHRSRNQAGLPQARPTRLAASSIRSSVATAASRSQPVEALP
jgi:hypothetical protein